MMQALPNFSKIQVNNIVSDLEHILKANLEDIQRLVEQSTPTWNSLVIPMERLEDNLNQFWSPISHLNSVTNTPALRAAYNLCLPMLSEYSSTIGQNTKLYEAYISLSQPSEFETLDYAQKKVINNALRDFKLSGVALQGEEKQKFCDLQQKLSQLENKFNENVLDATHGWSMTITEKEKLEGIPEHAMLSAQAAAKAHNETGYRFGLDFPSYHAIMTYADDRKLRETCHHAYVTRASDTSPMAPQWDNKENIDLILQYRDELARLLGFDNYAHYSLATKMAHTVEEVMDFLNNLLDVTKALAKKEYENLCAFVGLDSLAPWDISYYTEKLRQHRYNVSPEDLRPYFPISKVLTGMFKIIEILYGMQVVEKTGIETWHPDVRFFEIRDQNNEIRGQFYVDLYARAQKREGAWMGECQNKRRLENGQMQIPIAYLVTNFSAPTGNKPALLTHEEVETLFHEFGHGLHHMLSKIEYTDVSGIRGVPWDAVELPSQFMENFCWDPQGLALISGHYQTQAPLPPELLEKLKDAKNFQSALQLIRQLEFSLFDFHLHSEYAQGETVQSLLNTIRKTVCVVPIAEYNRFQNTFGHIFGGGYAAGYYSYLWAEVLACDAFSKFEEEGVLNPKTGQAFLQAILEQGGAKEPSELFLAFRGHAPQLEPLLRHRGLIA